MDGVPRGYTEGIKQCMNQSTVNPKLETKVLNLFITQVCAVSTSHYFWPTNQWYQPVPTSHLVLEALNQGNHGAMESPVPA